MSKAEGKGQRRVKVSVEWIEGMLKGGTAVSADLPDDARLIDSWRSDEHGFYVFLFESEEWGDMVEGERIPEADVKVKELWEEA